MTEMSDMLKRENPLKVYNKLVLKHDELSGPSSRKQNWQQKIKIGDFFGSKIFGARATPASLRSFFLSLLFFVVYLLSTAGATKFVMFRK
jgi:hypothetical protein